MKISVVGTLIGAAILAIGPTTVRAAEKSDGDRLHDRISEVNQHAKKAGFKTAIQRVSTETGVPVEQLETIHKRYPEAGAAGILIASVLADETKQPADKFAKSHESGKSWTSIAHENKVSTDKLIERLDRLDRALGTVGENPNKEKRK